MQPLEVHSETSSVLSFDLNVDLQDLDLRFAEKVSGEEWEEVWQPRKAKEEPAEARFRLRIDRFRAILCRRGAASEQEAQAESPVSPLKGAQQKCRCAVQ